jgi:hypothetical protein
MVDPTDQSIGRSSRSRRPYDHGGRYHPRPTASYTTLFGVICYAGLALIQLRFKPVSVGSAGRRPVGPLSGVDLSYRSRGRQDRI